MMNETFVADTPKDAYNQAIEKYGENIKLISAKQVQYKDGQLRCEISIEIDETRFLETSVDDNSTFEVTHTDDEVLLNELEELKNQLSQMKDEMLLQSTSDNEEHTIAQKVKALFLDKGISEKWLDDKLMLLMGNSILSDEKLLLSYLLEEIDESLHVEEEALEQSKIMMLVGPTGVGKTTTLAKLAARYAYMMDKPYKVAFINLDSYKIGAIDQLEHYADIMQIEHLNVASVEEFSQAIESLKGHDIILVDTAGMSPYDTQKFLKTVEFVQSDSPINIEVHLVLPATVKYEDMDDIYHNFSFLNLNSVLISKFDETKHLGTLLNFMLLYELPMSYFSIGQEVPDDLITASKEYILERFIGDLE